MSIRLLIPSTPLLLAAALAAQPTLPTTQPSTQPTDAELVTEETGIVETPEMRIAKLQAELDQLEAELARVREIERKGGMVAIVRQRLTEAPDSVPSYTPEAMQLAQKPRLFFEEEKEKLPPTTLFTVKGAPIAQSDFDRTYKFLKTFMDDEAAMRREAMLALAKRKAAMMQDPLVIVESQSAITEVYRAISTEASTFEELCAKYSKHPSRESGGLVQGVTRDAMDPLLMQMVFDLEPGEDSGIYPSTEGYHFVELIAKHKGPSEAEDKVDFRQIMIPFSKNVDELHAQVERGEVEIAFREQHDLDLFLR